MCFACAFSFKCCCRRSIHIPLFYHFHLEPAQCIFAFYNDDTAFVWNANSFHNEPSTFFFLSSLCCNNPKIMCVFFSILCMLFSRRHHHHRLRRRFFLFSSLSLLCVHSLSHLLFSLSPILLIFWKMLLFRSRKKRTTHTNKEWRDDKKTFSTTFPPSAFEKSFE